MFTAKTLRKVGSKEIEYTELVKILWSETSVSDGFTGSLNQMKSNYIELTIFIYKSISEK